MNARQPEPGIEIVTGDALVDGDFRRLAALHLAELPASNVSLSGRAGAEAFYRFVASSGQETVYAALGGGEVRAGAVVTSAPHTLSRRFALHLLLRPLTAAGIALAMLRARGARLADAPEAAGDLVEAPDRLFTDADLVPEISIIFIDAAMQGKGVGTRLLAAIEGDARAAGHPRCYARTNARRDNRAITFYDRSRFARLGYARSRDKMLVVFGKPLDAEAA